MFPWSRLIRDPVVQNGTLNPGKVLSGSQTCMTRNIHASLSDAVTKATNTYFCFLDPRKHGMIVFQPFISSSGIFFSHAFFLFSFLLLTKIIYFPTGKRQFNFQRRWLVQPAVS